MYIISENSLLHPLLHFIYSDLSDVMHKVHETFIALAAQLHEFHEAVKVRLYVHRH